MQGNAKLSKKDTPALHINKNIRTFALILQ